jgi:hypothetical protein
MLNAFKEVDMRIRNSRLAITLLLAGFAVAFFVAPLHATVLSGVEDYFASGPAYLMGGQSASACATNPDDSPVSVLIGLLQADTSSLLAKSQIILQPGLGVCVSYSRGVPPAANTPSANVYAVVVPNGTIDSSGRIIQDRPGSGGCIVASLQIQMVTLNNTPGQTIVYAQMIKYHEARQQNANQNGREGN